MIKNTAVACGAALVAATAALGGYGLSALAEGAPTSQPLFYSGTLEDGGRLAEGRYDVTVKLFDRSAAGDDLCEVSVSDLAVERGRFRIDVSSCGPAIEAEPDAWVEVTVRSESNVDRTFDRTKIGAVPYALQAQHAVTATSASMAERADAASGALKQTIDGLTAKRTFVSGSIAEPITAQQHEFTLVPYEEDVDELDEYAAATGFNPIQDGVYRVCASVLWAANDAACELDFFIDDQRQRGIGASRFGVATGCVDVKLSAGHSLTVKAYQTNYSPSSTIVSNAPWSYLTIVRVD